MERKGSKPELNHIFIPKVGSVELIKPLQVGSDSCAP